MNNLSGWFRSSAHLAIPLMLWLASHPLTCAAATNSAPSEAFDYAAPRLLTGTVYAAGSNRTNLLFTFQRTATRSGSTIHVERRFDRPDGSTGAVENIVFESGRLVSYEMKELQAGLWGTIQIFPDPTKPDRQEILIKHGRDTEPKGKGMETALPKDTVIDDTLYPFIMAHWTELQAGAGIKFRFVSLEWEKTFGFKLTKATEADFNGKPVIWIKMEPTNLLVARFTNPMYFAFEKDGSHRMLEYIGRTTPRFKKGKQWKYLDAETVFDWK